MWKYVAAIIASAVAIWAAFAFIDWDLNWAANVDAADRALAVWLWLGALAFACIFINPTP